GALRQDVSHDIGAIHHVINDEICQCRQAKSRLQQHSLTDFWLLFGALISLDIGMTGLVAIAFICI
ncbi:hypothetical protein LXA24_17555, partial [Erwinia amylovora]|nr:hypothetical protein [Erwinia amylovora]